MMRKFLFSVSLLLISFNLFSQVKVKNNYTAPFFLGNVKVQDTLGILGIVGIGSSSFDASAILNITSTTKGILYPRMTTIQRDAIGSPATALSIYNLTNNDPNFFNGTAWRRITHAPGSSLKIGSVIFATGVSALDGDSVNFFWDNTTKRLGIGMSDPDEKLEVAGRIHLGQTTAPAVTTDKLYNESGDLFWNGIDLTSPPQWLDIQRKSATNDQTGIDQGTDIILDSANGNITYNTATGIVSLKAGKIYALWGTFAAFSISTNETVAIQWVKASDNTPLYEGHETRLRPQSSSSNGNNQPTIKLIYKPTVDIDVKLRCTEYTGSPDTISLYWDRSFATINEIR